MQIGTTKFLSPPPPHTFHCYQNLHITTTSAQQQRSAFHCQIINKNNHYAMATSTARYHHLSNERNNRKSCNWVIAGKKLMIVVVA